ncbi:MULTISPECIES: hypothetical protein [Streptomyces]|uniref:hypothetical protein n=1 Tax=Streptomyces TaxID=1883 RepID=UPI0037FCDD33
MNTLFGTLGPVGLAVVLTIVLIFGSKGEGEAKSLSWGWCLVLSLLAGASYAAAGWPFSLVRGLVKDVVELVNGAIPGVTLPAIGLSMLAIIAWKKLSKRGVCLWAIPWWYIAAASDGGLGVFASKIADVVARLAA